MDKAPDFYASRLVLLTCLPPAPHPRAGHPRRTPCDNLSNTIGGNGVLQVV